ncbi:Diphthamide biosynthesis protein 2 [Massospora cicadina]|nr:Diphthamide biosynthesis protein 2 [Massospora cicadina]
MLFVARGRLKVHVELAIRVFAIVALQFPDQLLPVSNTVSRCLGELCPTAEFFILADTSYGSCCNDAVAASHVDADCLVHFGHSCLSVLLDLPVIYSFDAVALDIQRCVSQVRHLGLHPSRLLVLGELGYSHCLGKALRQSNGGFRFGLQGVGIDGLEVVAGLLPLTQNVSSARTDLSALESERLNEKLIRVGGRYFPSDKPLGDASILYIGGETIELTNLLMTKDPKIKASIVYRFDPTTGEAFEDGQNINRRLMRRHHLVQKARDASTFGIVVGTLGVANYLPMIQHVRELVEANGGKSYTFVMGKLNVAKLANFLEIDVYVLVACPENSLIDSKEFLRPIITPLNLGWLSIRSRSGPPSTVPRRVEDAPHYSLITGKLVNPRRYRPTPAVELDMGTQGALLKQDQPTDIARALGSAAGEFLATRSFQGLEPSLGQGDVHLAEEGRQGIARGYKNEKQL